MHEKLRDSKFAQPTTVFVKTSQPAFQRLAGKKKLTEMEACRGKKKLIREGRGDVQVVVLTATNAPSPPAVQKLSFLANSVDRSYGILFETF